MGLQKEGNYVYEGISIFNYVYSLPILYLISSSLLYLGLYGKLLYSAYTVLFRYGTTYIYSKKIFTFMFNWNLTLSYMVNYKDIWVLYLYSLEIVLYILVLLEFFRYIFLLHKKYILPSLRTAWSCRSIYSISYIDLLQFCAGSSR